MSRYPLLEWIAWYAAFLFMDAATYFALGLSVQDKMYWMVCAFILVTLRALKAIHNEVRKDESE